MMNGVGPTTVGRLFGHSKRETPAIQARLDDGALQEAAAQAATVIAREMGYRAESPVLLDGTQVSNGAGDSVPPDESSPGGNQHSRSQPPDHLEPSTMQQGPQSSNRKRPVCRVR